jgi:gas vesicle protein
MDGKGLLAGLLLGVGLGATLGVMYAPRPGSETREQLAETAGTVKESLAERVRSAPLVLIVPIAFQYQHQDQIHHHYPTASSETS